MVFLLTMVLTFFSIGFDFLQVGAADYIAISRNYHTVFISDIPVMSMKIRDKVASSLFSASLLYSY